MACVDCYPGRNKPSLCNNKGDQDVSPSSASQPARLDPPVVPSHIDGAASQSLSKCGDPIDSSKSPPAIDTDEPERCGSLPPPLFETPPSEDTEDINILEGGLVPPVAVRPMIAKIYDEIVHWKKKFFIIPCNAVGKAFVNMLATQLQNYVDSKGSDGTALYNFMTLPTLMLQKPTHESCGYKMATEHLRRRLNLWEEQDLHSLLDEGRCLQKHAHGRRPGGQFKGEKDRAREFGLSMASGEVHRALQTLAEETCGIPSSGVLQMGERVTLSDGRSALVEELLAEKHPPPQRASEDILLEGEPSHVNPIRFEALTPKLIERIALQCKGSAGPSGLDANAWRRLCITFKGPSRKMCQALSNLARLLASESVDSTATEPLMACRLIALDKKPGVRPIGVCEVVRRIVAKSILRVVNKDVEEACGFLQKCSGLPAGQEAAVHAMQQVYEDESTEGLLLVDAKNAFNSLNREAALQNIQQLCPALSLVLQNCYQAPSRLFVSGSGELLSREGTTQGDPLSMPFYALATLPLVQHLQKEHPSVRQAWLADDSAGAGRLRDLRKWWDTVSVVGAEYGYYTNCLKTVLLVKEHLYDLALEIFQGTGVELVVEGVRYLGSAVGEAGFVERFFLSKIEEWKREMVQLSQFAQTEPHAAFTALTHGLRGRYTYILRTLPVSLEGLQSMDDTIVTLLLPALTGRTNFSTEEIELLRLPARLGGIGIPHLVGMAGDELVGSTAMTKGQVREIVLQNTDHPTPQVDTVHREAVQSRNHRKAQRRKNETVCQRRLTEAWASQKARVELLSAKGSSSWLTALPLKEHGFWLNKRDFRDALALRYDWSLENIPLTCICGNDFTPDHAMVCSFGGFPTTRHNEMRNTIGNFLSEVCSNVAIEPLLQPLSGEVFLASSTTTSQEARSDIRAAGFWTRMEEAFFDVRIFHANAPSNKSKTVREACEHHERLKKLEYEERIVNVDRGSFCPLVFSTTGAIGPLCERFLKRLAGKISDLENSNYSEVMAFLRCRISFALLRSAVMCIRGARSRRHAPAFDHPQLSMAEARVEDC